MVSTNIRFFRYNYVQRFPFRVRGYQIAMFDFVSILDTVRNQRTFRSSSIHSTMSTRGRQLGSSLDYKHQVQPFAAAPRGFAPSRYGIGVHHWRKPVRRRFNRIVFAGYTHSGNLDPDGGTPELELFGTVSTFFEKSVVSGRRIGRRMSSSRYCGPVYHDNAKRWKHRFVCCCG